jgi:hypothetical protein
MMRMPRLGRRLISIATVSLMLTGCVQSKPEKPAEPLPQHVQMMIGQNAKLVKEGKPPLEFKAGREGNLSIVDMTAGAMNAYAMIRVPGSVVVVDAKDNGIRIRNPKQPQVREMLTTPTPIDPEHVYRIYYAPNR